MSKPLPNILLITGDHARADALSCAEEYRGAPGSLVSQSRTPCLDQLAADGFRFSHCHTPNPICVPARASITTGQYPHRCTGKKSNGGRIKEDSPKLAAYLRERGYFTAAIGKLHYVPYAAPGDILSKLDLESAELCEEGRIVAQFGGQGERKGLEDYHDFLERAGWGGFERAHGIGNNDVHPSPAPLPAELHEENWVARRSLKALERHRARKDDSRPWFLWASFTKPHPPYDPPSDILSKLDPRDAPVPALWGDGDDLFENRDQELFARRWQFGWERLSVQAVQNLRSHYLALMTFQDLSIARLIDDLKEAGELENTWIIYTSDHGDLLGDFGRFFKSCLYDGAVRAPLVVRPPASARGQIGKLGQTLPQLVGLQDLFPSICDFAGLPTPPELDGESLLPLIQSPARPGRSQIVSQTGDAPLQKYMIRDRHWKYIYTEAGGVEELYDVSRNQPELDNLAGRPEQASRLRQFREALIDACRRMKDQAMLDGSDLKASARDSAGKPEFNDALLGWREY